MDSKNLTCGENLTNIKYAFGLLGIVNQLFLLALPRDYQSYIYAILVYASDQPIVLLLLLFSSKLLHNPIAGLGNNPKSQERAFQLGATLGNLLGCQVRIFNVSISFAF